MTRTAQTIDEILRQQAERSPEAPALLAPGYEPLAYGELLQQIERTRDALAAAGVGRGDRVGLVLQNGPDLAVAFLAATGCATCAPLNPGSGSDELAFYLDELQAAAVVIDGEAPSAARDAAALLGTPIVELHRDPEAPAGCFTLRSERRSPAASPEAAAPDDVALILHTSGTASRPKAVPLTQSNLAHAASNIASWHALGASDRCLGVMPLFHIQGLVAGLLGPLAAGGSVVCTPRFDPDAFFEWLDGYAATWYTAAPAHHQAILLRASRHQDVLARRRLRFVRSSSAPLAPKVMADLESVFGAPVVEAYGLTETASHTTCSPLPPAARKPGSVGLPTGPGIEVAIMGGSGTLLPPGEPGEIVVRGPTVMRGYGTGGEPDRSAFVDGWFRTGDRGMLDTDGYLTVAGRLGEIINKGGEKISPAEVDDCLLRHPDVVDAASFAIPHRSLGEDVAAAVVLREGASAGEPELRAAVASRLSEVKVPRRIAIVDRIPKSASGKVQRDRLARAFGLAERDSVAPRNATEAQLAKIWREVLEKRRVGVTDSFYELGGDSLKEVIMFTELERAFGVVLQPDWLWTNEPTIAQLAGRIAEASPVMAAE